MSNDATRVDLGDDLIESSVIMPDPQEGISGNTIEDQFENAKILANEGFIEDAKKVLRKILIQDPKHAPARQQLQQILDRELKDLLSDREAPLKRPRLFERKGKQARAAQVSSEDVLRELEEELGLDEARDEKGEPVTVRADVEGASESDRIDLGIAFIEMGLHEEAIQHLKAALEMIESQLEPNMVQKTSATALLARAYLSGQKPFEAIHLLHAILRDAEVPPADKIEFFYLMGISFEQTGDRKGALPWFKKVRDLDPRYRDIHERLRKPET
jgi:tetratricopeptide (TPR) repeat protein